MTWRPHPDCPMSRGYITACQFRRDERQQSERVGIRRCRDGRFIAGGLGEIQARRRAIVLSGFVRVGIRRGWPACDSTTLRVSMLSPDCEMPIEASLPRDRPQAIVSS